VDTSTNGSQATLAVPLERKNERGAITLELIIVLTLMLIVVGFEVPQLLQATHTSILREQSESLCGLIQKARIMAEKQNTNLPVYAGSVETNRVGAFIGVAGSSWTSQDPDIPYPAGVTNGSTSNAPATLNPGFTPEATGTTLYFSPRGIPVKPSGSAYVASQGVIFYITDTTNDWAAVSVSPVGTSKVWIWNGSAWY
jgi:Tfp pilus assembly protein FimT